MTASIPLISVNTIETSKLLHLMRLYKQVLLHEQIYGCLMLLH